MKNFLSALLLLVLITTTAVTSVATWADVLIMNGKLVTPSGILENGQVLVRGGKVQEVGTTINAPGVEVVDAAGAWVTPGLFDSGTQLGLGEIESSSVRSDHRVKGTDLGAGFEVSLAIDRNSTLIPIARMEGVTRALVRPSASDEVFAGQTAIIHLGGGPDTIVNESNAIFVILGEHSQELANGSRAKALMDVVDSLNEAKLYREKRKDFDARKLRDLRQSQADLEAMLPVLDKKKPLAVYANRASDIEMILDQLGGFDINLVLLGAREGWKVKDLLLKNGVPVVINPMENTPSDFDEVGSRLDNAAILANAGVLVAFMTEDDFSDLRRLTQGAGVAVAYGMTWQSAFDAITINPAIIWGIDTSYGALQRGRDADIVIWDGDPLELMSAPTRLMIRGQWIELKSRQTMLRDRYSDLSKKEPPFGYR